jgi:hypothetical protein
MKLFKVDNLADWFVLSHSNDQMVPTRLGGVYACSGNSAYRFAYSSEDIACWKTEEAALKSIAAAKDVDQWKAVPAADDFDWEYRFIRDRKGGRYFARSIVAKKDARTALKCLKEEVSYAKSSVVEALRVERNARAARVKEGKELKELERYAASYLKKNPPTRKKKAAAKKK